MIPGKGGDFIVIANGKKLWDKNGDDSGFPENEVIIEKLEGV